MNSKNQRRSLLKRKAPASFHLQLFMFVLLIAATAAINIWNYFSLRHLLQLPTENYAQNISVQSERYTVLTVLITAGISLMFLLCLGLLLAVFRSYRRQMTQLSTTDPVTGQINNTAFRFCCKKLIQNAPVSTYTIVCLNIRNFKLINENFGSLEGDRTLCYILSAISQSIGSEELACRGEADTFYLCLKESDHDKIVSRLDNITEQINRFNAELAEPYYLVVLQGAYLVKDSSLEVTILQDRAKTACRSLRDSDHSACAFYSESLTKQLQKDQEINSLFESSLKNHDFKVYLQPKVSLKTGKISGAEALVRWHHPKRGMIFPSDFIPLFERNGNICQLDYYMFEEVCRLMGTWKEAGKPLIPVSVNLSRYHFKTSDFLSHLSEIADKYNVDRNLIELELTESIFFDDQTISLVKDYIHQAHDAGFLCSLDDFGTGYSSLGLLKDFDIDTIKLDRKFFLDLEQQKAQDVVACMTDLSRKLNMKTVAEGVESPQHLEFLQRIQCDMIQGYVYSRPLPVDEFESWAANYQ